MVELTFNDGTAQFTQKCKDFFTFSKRRLRMQNVLGWGSFVEVKNIFYLHILIYKKIELVFGHWVGLFDLDVRVNNTEPTWQECGAG